MDREQARKEALKQKTKSPMPMQDPEVRVHNFSSVELGYTPEIAWTESSRCIACKDPRCVPYCPVEIDIRAMMDAVRLENYEEAFQVICRSNLFPAITGRVCPQESQCEMVCVRGVKGEPVGIGFVEKFLADWARERGIRPKADMLPPNGKTIAIIGSGPAGMSAAADLVRLGYGVTIYEALHRPGGVLIYGIPEFRLPKAIVDYEIDNLRALGVEIVLNTLVGRTITMDELIQDFDAIFVGTGAGLPYFMNIPGEQLNGVYSANEFLTRANLMNARSFPEAPTPIHHGKCVGVVGGGNVAMDAARVSKRLGAEQVDIIYRRTRDEMPARRDEIHHAEEEGINFLYLHAPVAIYGDEEGWVKEVEMIRMELGEPDDSGRRRPVVVPDSNFRRPYDVLVMAIGQGPNPLLARLTPYLKTNKWGQLVIDPKKLSLDGKEAAVAAGETPPEIPIICAGGDIIGSQAGAGGTVIAAMGHGKIAARTIHEALQERPPKSGTAPSADA
ncbi:MAG: NADPH-dependent glutamate synthase [Candidatus Eisenbacteria bacterium]|nr:NADPH-dependent glutamate synthase [Candidatus Eisenbacteria bacterium]